MMNNPLSFLLATLVELLCLFRLSTFFFVNPVKDCIEIDLQNCMWYNYEHLEYLGLFGSLFLLLPKAFIWLGVRQKAIAVAFISELQHEAIVSHMFKV